jgi:hypothetical protein
MDETGDADLRTLIERALENGDDYSARQYARLASTPEKRKEFQKLIRQEMYKN